MRLLAVIVAALVSMQCLADAESDYLLHCAGCHRPDGAGVPPEVPSLREELAWLTTTADGRDYLVRVPGASQAPVSDAELAAVINWILVEFGSAAATDEPGTISAEEVSESRSRVLADPARKREELWARYGADGNRN